MAFVCVTVKEEPVGGTESEDLTPPADQENGTEFINIKVEREEEVPNIRIKSELQEQQSPPAPKSRSSWHLPVKQETNHPSNYVEVTIKEELDDSTQSDEQHDTSYPEPDTQHHQRNPLYLQQAQHDTSYVQPTTSSVDYNDFAATSSSQGFCCPICKKAFANPGNVQRHMLIHTKEKLKCNQCDGEFINKTRLERHIFSKHTTPGQRVYACDGCDKKFKSSSNLMQHKKVHLVIKPYKCPLCFKGFSFKNNLKKHQGKSRCKTPREEPIKCKICNKIFQKEYLLKSHLRRHETGKPFACDDCSMSFKYKSTLIRHIQMHNGIRPFQCPVCEKSFTHSALLKPHMRVHTGEKPYECPICNKCFGHKHNMQRHALRHNKVKHLVCDVCHKEFPKESRLKYHMKTHVNEKHFACNICPKRFSHKQNVLRHYTRKHPGQTYSCKDTDASVALKVWDTFKSKYCDDDEAELILG